MIQYERGIPERFSCSQAGEVDFNTSLNSSFANNCMLFFSFFFFYISRLPLAPVNDILLFQKQHDCCSVAVTGIPDLHRGLGTFWTSKYVHYGVHVTLHHKVSTVN